MVKRSALVVAGCDADPATNGEIGPVLSSDIRNWTCSKTRARQRPAQAFELQSALGSQPLEFRAGFCVRALVLDLDQEPAARGLDRKDRCPSCRHEAHLRIERSDVSHDGQPIRCAKGNFALLHGTRPPKLSLS